MRDGSGSELGGRGEEAGRIGGDEQQIEMRNADRQDDHRQAPEPAIECAPDQTGDRHNDSGTADRQCNDQLAPEIRIAERVQARPPWEWPDRLLMRSRRAGGKKAGGDDHEGAQDQFPSRSIGAYGGAPAVSVRRSVSTKRLSAARQQQQQKQADLHQRDVAVARCRTARACRP